MSTDKIAEGLRLSGERKKEELNKILDQCAKIAGQVKSKRGVLKDRDKVYSFTERQQQKTEIAKLTAEFEQLKQGASPIFRFIGDRDYEQSANEYLGELNQIMKGD